MSARDRVVGNGGEPFRLMIVRAVVVLMVDTLATWVVLYGGDISGDALVGLYGTSLGYVFGAASIPATPVETPAPAIREGDVP